ncbi:MAG TPA: hypothetical protein PKN22_08395 [Taishania sp.]|nr:hypothetical protein [Taishania sp.]
MAKDIFDSILEKEFHQLTPQELTELNDYCQTATEFDAFKKVLQHTRTLANAPKITPLAATKDKLDDLFASTHAPKGILFYQTPIFKIAASLLLLIGVGIGFYYINSTPQKVQLAENTQKETPAQEKNEIAPPTKAIKATTDSSTATEKSTATKKTPEDKQLIAPATAASPVQLMESSINEESLTRLSQDAISSMDNDKMDANTQKAKAEMPPPVSEKAHPTFSTPATSVQDIQVISTKRAQNKSVATSVNLAQQNNVLKFLVVKY